MFEDVHLWLVLGSMAGTASLIGLWFDREGGPPGSDEWSEEP
jgi:hypothetical protein